MSFKPSYLCVCMCKAQCSEECTNARSPSERVQQVRRASRVHEEHVYKTTVEMFCVCVCSSVYSEHMHKRTHNALRRRPMHDYQQQKYAPVVLSVCTNDPIGCRAFQSYKADPWSWWQLNLCQSSRIGALTPTHTHKHLTLHSLHKIHARMQTLHYGCIKF